MTDFTVDVERAHYALDQIWEKDAKPIFLLRNPIQGYSSRLFNFFW